VIRRITPKTQEIDLHNGARLPAELIEGMSDKTTLEIQEIAEQTITRDDLNAMFQMINTTIVEAITEIRETLNKELKEAIEKEALARMKRDIELTEAIEKLQTRQDEQQYLIEYLVLLYESRFGPLNGSFPFITEDGFYLITESSDYLVVA